MTQFRTDPLTGRVETIGHRDGAAVNNVEQRERAELADYRRSLRDMLSGNTPFHEDPNKAVPTVEQSMSDSAIEGAWRKVASGVKRGIVGGGPAHVPFPMTPDMRLELLVDGVVTSEEVWEASRSALGFKVRAAYWVQHFDWIVYEKVTS